MHLRSKYRDWDIRNQFAGAKLDHVVFGPELKKNFEIRYPKGLSIGYMTAISGDCFISALGGVTIGRYCHIAKGLTIYSHNHNYKSEDYVPYDEKDILKPVIIGDCVWIGCNVTIAPGAEIGKGAILSSGSVIFGKIPECAIARGNPAEIIGYRDKDVFIKLYLEEKFK